MIEFIRSAKIDLKYAFAYIHLIKSSNTILKLALIFD